MFLNICGHCRDLVDAASCDKCGPRNFRRYSVSAPTPTAWGIKHEPALDADLVARLNERAG